MDLNRRKYIDVAKGIAMICIFLGHLGIYNINRVVYTFMVSLFFLIAGYFLNNKYSIKIFIMNKFKRLIIPYIFVSLIMLLLALVRNEVFLDGFNTKGIINKWMVAALFGTGASDVVFIGNQIPSIGAIWFLLAMFWGTVVFRCLLEVKPAVRSTIVFGVLFLSIWSSKIVFLPLSLQPGGVALFYIYIGYLIKKMEPLIYTLNIEVKVVFFILLLFCWLEAVIDYQWFLLVLADVGRGITDIFRSICGCLIIIMLSKCICRYKYLSNIFSFVGKYSILFLSVHLIELTYFPRNKMIDFLNNLHMSSTTSFISVVFFRLWMIIIIVYLLSKFYFIRKIYGFQLKDKGEKNE